MDITDSELRVSSESLVLHPIPTSADIMDDANDIKVESPDVDEIMLEVEKAAEELCDHQDGNISEVHQLWAAFRGLFTDNKHLKAENERLRTELKEVQTRIGDMSAAVVGNPDAKERVCQRVLLEERRDCLVGLLTNGQFPNWTSYVNCLPDGLTTNDAAEALRSLAKAAIPHYGARAQLPPPVRADSRWSALKGRRSTQDKQAREALKAEHARRLKEGREALAALELMKDEQVWRLILQK